MTTRYRGSKRRSLALLERAFAPLGFATAVDVFGGTGAVSHLLKRLGARVHYNDHLRANHAVGTALVENARVRLGLEAARALCRPVSGRAYDDVVERTFEGVFYLPDENRWLDVVAQNVLGVGCRFERAIAHFALFQACLMKRPFNLFHRANLALRTRDVARSFGNKATWERSFEEVFLAEVAAANAAVFDNGHDNVATCLDAEACPLEADLVYLDPPYVRADGRGVDYLDAYHFLEGLVGYHDWAGRIDRSRKHLPIAGPRSSFCDAEGAERGLARLVARAREARHVVVSYRADGRPSIERIARILRSDGRRVTRLEAETSYALARRASAEVVLVGTRT